MADEDFDFEGGGRGRSTAVAGDPRAQLILDSGAKSANWNADQQAIMFVLTALAPHILSPSVAKSAADARTCIQTFAENGNNLGITATETPKACFDRLFPKIEALLK